MRIAGMLAAALAAAVTSGCAYRPGDVVDPDTITLKTAIFDVADSLSAVREAYKDKPKVGLYVDEATVTFNISAASTETTGLQIGASSPAAISVIPITAQLSDQNVATATRGNQIIIKFKNISNLSGGKGGAVIMKNGGGKNVTKKPTDPETKPQEPQTPGRAGGGGGASCSGPRPGPGCPIMAPQQ